MRVRTTTDGSLTSNAYVRTTLSRSCTSGWTTTTSTSYGGEMTIKTVRDVVTPGFQSLLKCGKFLPLNPFEITTVKKQKLPCYFDHKRYAKASHCPSDPGRVIRDIFGPVSDPYPDWKIKLPEVPEAVITAVVNGAVADARSGVYDILTDIAEFGKTISLFRDTVYGVLTARRRVIDYVARQLRMNKKLRPKDVADIVTQKWLEYRYGWTPAYLSMKDAIEAFTTANRSFAKGRARQNLSDVLTDFSSRTYSSWAEEDTETLSYEIAVRGWAAAEFSFQDRVRVDPLVTGYEIIPFSFVLDWLVQVGTWIEAVSPFAAGKDLGACASIRTSSTRELWRTWRDIDTSSSTGDGLSTGLVARETVESYVRFAAEPSFPGWNPRINLPRLTDAASLFYQIALSRQESWKRLRI